MQVVRFRLSPTNDSTKVKNIACFMLRAYKMFYGPQVTAFHVDKYPLETFNLTKCTSNAVAIK